MSTTRKYLCGTPVAHCTGAAIATSQGLARKKTIKAHSSRSDAWRCHARYLVRVLGYTRVKGKSREFSPPDGGPVRFLPKKSRFGGLLRRGKEGTRSMPEGVHGVMTLT